MEPSKRNTDLPTLPLRVLSDAAKDTIGPNGSLYFFNHESSLDSSSATPSPDEDLKSSSTSLSSNPVSSPAGPQTNAVDTEAEDDIPLLKGAGKSDCAVSVVGFHECEKNVSVASLSDESSVWNSDVMQGVLKNAGSILLDPYKNEVFMNGSRASQVQKALRRPILPRRHHSDVFRKESRTPGTDSPRQHVNDSTLRRLSSGLWAVRKQAFQCGKQDGSRLLKQVQKQVIYSATCRTNPSIAMITTPEVYGLKVPMGQISEGSVIVDMEYIPFNDVRIILLENDKTIHDWLIGAAISITDQELTQCENVSLQSILPKFHDKASNIKTCLPGSPLLTADETQEIVEYFDLILAYYDLLQDLEVPVGVCHGELTSQNMLVDPVNRELCVFDFLDSFVTAILCVYEFLSATGVAWSRHLRATKSLLDIAEGGMIFGEVQVSPSTDRRAVFWNFARQDYLAAYINECQTRLDTNNFQLWRDAGLSINENGLLIMPEIGVREAGNTIQGVMIPNALVWLSSRLCNFIAAGEGFAPVSAGDKSEVLQEDELGEYGKSQKSELDRWRGFAREIEVWFEGLPATFQPTTRIKSSRNVLIDPEESDQAKRRTFYESWYANGMCGATMQQYHMTRILLLVNKPHETTMRRSTVTSRLKSYRLIEEEVIFHCYEICGIALSRPEASVRIHQTQPLFVAGQCLTQSHERHLVLELLRGIETDLGWATEYRVQQLLKDWGPDD